MFLFCDLDSLTPKKYSKNKMRVVPTEAPRSGGPALSLHDRIPASLENS